jgi:hypothetical protein
MKKKEKFVEEKNMNIGKEFVYNSLFEKNMKKTIWKYTCVLRSVFVIFDVRIYVGKFF